MEPMPPPKAGRARRMSLDIFQKAVSDIKAEIGFAKYMEAVHAMAEAHETECECCGLLEDYTPAYIRRVKEHFCGKWVCGLCAEAANEESRRPGVRMEEAVRVHMEVCEKFKRSTRMNPAIALANSMAKILRKSCLAQTSDRKFGNGIKPPMHAPMLKGGK
ncbi:hypothetical protein AMTRI_Chr13g123330 [Amborella trichopoda]|uniref:DUF1677 family protein n=1 Tax=Amborella trichopoda TaxID=13333 RepID=U5CWB6_AMBTC|nr:uncharacterized protein LOC18442500 [Amborella trichopoda]ERN14245.1 hypothetical protein AMTR_s00033p00142400 [Amborella trichopoda]|eukprot:XP_006852778.1 uncharacterized protein LOC18442500 [Amborella trichopoda]